MTHYAVHVLARFVVDADSPEQALEWLNADVELRATSFGHQQLVVVIDDNQRSALRAHDQDAFYAAHASLPVLAQWSPAAWPARSCTPLALIAPKRGTA